MTDIPAGSAEGQRHGSKIGYTYIKIKGHCKISTNPDASSNGARQRVYMWLVLDKFASGQSFSYGDVFHGPGGNCELWTWQNKDRFVVVGQQVLPFQLPLLDGSNKHVGVFDKHKEFEFKRKLSFECHYGENGSVIRNNLFLLFACTVNCEMVLNVIPQIWFHSR